MAKVELKQPVVDEIKGVLEGAAGAVIVDYRGLTVAVSYTHLTLPTIA